MSERRHTNGSDGDASAEMLPEFSAEDAGSDPYSLSFCGFTLDVREKALHYHGNRIALTPKEIDLLILLVNARSRPVTRDEIVDRLWPGDDATDSVVSQTVYRLRRAMTQYNPSSEYIKTLRRAGYQFIPAVAACEPPPPAVPFFSELFRDYRVGVHRLAQQTRTGVEEAIAILERLLEADPLYVPAIAGLAHAQALRAQLLYADPRTAYVKAKRLCASALHIDPDCGQAFAVLSHVLLQFNRNYAAARSAADRALALTPYSVWAIRAAVWTRVALGETREDVPALTEGLARNPASAALTVLYGIALYFACRYFDAHAQFLDALFFDANFAPAQYYDACALSMLERFDEAQERLAQISPAYSPARVLALRAHIAGKRRNDAEFSRCLNDLERMPVVSNILQAVAVAGGGRKQDALERLVRAFNHGEAGLAIAAVDPLLTTTLGRRAAPLLAGIRSDGVARCRKCARPVHGRERYACAFDCTFCPRCAALAGGVCTECAQPLRRVEVS
ncbi:MAG TPA: winged helix-turn-helix domain-containing protein [Candidatus Baltobacteraceae bacterium]|jgi:DNA-binding winged helix-turn-helix (wHTH) protein|nr:winged helix-turn-helix domain-containing protein [Candidatus Baltobacteraceae bacterium]